MDTDHDPKTQAELDIITAADWWACDVMRLDQALNPSEQRLFDAVMNHRRICRPDIAGIIPTIPKPPHLPTDLHYDDIPTKRYSEVPTIPSPPFGIRAVRIPSVDIDIPDYNEEEKTWIGKLKPE